MTEERDFSRAWVFDGRGGARALPWEEARTLEPEEGFVWLDLDRMDEDVQRWVQHDSGLDALMAHAVLTEETRPRSTVIGDTMLLILRGVNLNPGADPVDMVSVRIWFSPRRVIALRRYQVRAIDDLVEAIDAGQAPGTSGDFLTRIAAKLIDRMGPVVEKLEDDVDALGDRIIKTQSHALRSQLGALRRDAIILRRYLSPQRDVLSRLQVEPVTWLDDMNRAVIREATDRLTRYVEDLDSARDRATVTHEELVGLLSERMNRTMYVLSLVAGIFLPLGLLTGLLGINVGGIPGVENPAAFWIVCGVLLALAGLTLWLFRRARWF